MCDPVSFVLIDRRILLEIKKLTDQSSLTYQYQTIAKKNTDYILYTLLLLFSIDYESSAQIIFEYGL